MSNWKIKVLVQFILAHVPFGEQLNHSLQRLHRREEARKKGITDELPKLGTAITMIRNHIVLRGASVVEVGTGWVPLPTTLLYLAGARRILTYDHVRHVRFELVREMLDVFVGLPRELSEILDVPEEQIKSKLAGLCSADNLEHFLSLAGIEYVAPGDAAATGEPEGSVDLFFSYAVLEHVSEKVLDALVKESRRLLRPGGCFYAYIGLHDHYAGFDKRISKVNFLRYPEWVWRLFVKNKISYHNRLRLREFVERLEGCGGSIKEIRSIVDPEDIARVRSMNVDRRFEHFSPEECAVTTAEIVANFPARIQG
ncbi:MAG: class I SAM-dependent methyltransferase [Planctomycetota bacterium]